MRDRVNWSVRAATNVMKKYEKLTSNDDQKEVLADLLADLMHWSEVNGYDFDAALENGRANFKEESGK